MFRRNILKLSVVTLVVLMAIGSTASAQTIWGVHNNGLPTQTIVRFNAATPGTLTTVGATGIASATFINSLDFNGPGNQLFLATNAVGAGFWFDVNQVTGAATNPRGSGLGADQLSDISWDYTGNRMLGLGISGVAGSGARLYSIVPATGAATLLGPITGFAPVNDGFGISLAVRPSDGRVFAHALETDRWYDINPGTLVATPLGVLPVDTNFGQGGTFDPASGTLFHAMLQTTGGNQSRLATINTTTGAPTFIAPNIGSISPGGLNQIGDIAIQIPEPASLSLLGLSGLALVRRRRA